jgi:hypothetical protein
LLSFCSVCFRLTQLDSVPPFCASDRRHT